MSALALEGTPAQQQQALADAGILTPACSSATPQTAITAAVTSAAQNIISMAAPYQSIATATSATSSTTSGGVQ